MPRLVNIDMENSMRPTWGFIHFLRCDLPELHSCVDYINSLWHWLYRHFHQPFHEYLTISLLSNREIVTLVRIEQILDLVLINLVETNMDVPGNDDVSFLLLLQVFDYEINRLGYDAFTPCVDVVEHSHSVCLTSSCLPINKVCAVISIKDVHYQRKTSLLEDWRLRNLVIKDLIELVFFRGLLRNVQLDECGILRVQISALPLVLMPLVHRVKNCIFNFILKRRPQPDEDLHCLQVFNVWFAKVLATLKWNIIVRRLNLVIF